MPTEDPTLNYNPDSAAPREPVQPLVQDSHEPLGTTFPLPSWDTHELATAVDEQMLALSDYVLARLWGIPDPAQPGAWILPPVSPWRRFVTNALLPADYSQYMEGRAGAASAADPYSTIQGPSASGSAGISGFYTPTTHATPSVPGDITWTSPTTITPRNLIALTTVSEERVYDAFTFDVIDETSKPVVGRSHVHPAIVAELAEAVMRTENVSWAAGSGGTTDPITGVSAFSGITTQAAEDQLGINDAIIAIENLRVLKRYPNAVFISASTEKLWRLAKDASNRFVFDPQRPLSLCDVPVVMHNGIASGASTYALVGDFKKIICEWRFMPNGKLAMATSSNLGSNFALYQRTYRVTERWDHALVPGYGPSIVKITGIVAPGGRDREAKHGPRTAHRAARPARREAHRGDGGSIRRR